MHVDFDELIITTIRRIEDRLRAVENSLANIEGQQLGKRGVGKVVLGVATVSAAIGSLVGVVFSIL
jgi:hypothetical protein